MSDISVVKTIFKSPATIEVGDGERTAISSLMFGTVAIPAISIIATNNSKSASAAVSGMTAAHNVLMGMQGWAAANETVIISAVKGIAGGIQVTATNPSGSAVTTSAATACYFAFK